MTAFILCQATHVTNDDLHSTKAHYSLFAAEGKKKSAAGEKVVAVWECGDPTSFHQAIFATPRPQAFSGGNHILLRTINKKKLGASGENPPPPP